MKKQFYILLIILIPISSFAQRWKKERASIVFGTGTSHFLGDLGGGKKQAAHFFGLRDLDFVTTRPVIQGGFRYRIYEDLSVRTNLTYAMISSKDEASQELRRQLRNLSFRSHIWQLGTQLEYAFIKDKQAPRYAFNSLSKARQISAFLIVGFGGLYYNPQANYEGEWINLRPIGTEGQGHVDSYEYYTNPSKTETATYTVKTYGKFTWEATIGLGMKYNINRFWSVGLDITNSYTGSDFIDDAHDRYFNFVEMGIDNPMGAELADKQLKMDGQTQYGPWPSGQPLRGDPDYNDAYILSVISVHYKFKNTMRGQPKF